MNRAVPAALFIAGVLLIAWGFSSLQSFSSDISKFFTGSPTNKSIWLMIAGVLVTVVGLSGFMGGRRGE